MSTSPADRVLRASPPEPQTQNPEPRTLEAAAGVNRSMASEPPYDPLYLEGIRHFNACDYFESHEVWEELWTEYRGDARKFYQGLIQAAVALYHFGNGNLRGARKLHGSVHGYLEPYLPSYLGLDLVTFLREFDHCLADVVANPEATADIPLDPELLPEIHLAPSPT